MRIVRLRDGSVRQYRAAQRKHYKETAHPAAPLHQAPRFLLCNLMRPEYFTPKRAASMQHMSLVRNVFREPPGGRRFDSLLC